MVDTGVASVLRRRRGRRRLILAYHNILPEGISPWGERSLHLPLARFREHLEVLEASAVLVSLDRLLDPAPMDDGRLDDGGLAVALTFDDGYGGAVAAVRELLVPRGIPCTIFVNPGHPVEQPFWWDVLGASVHASGELPDPVRSHCLVELQGDRDRVLDWARTRWPLNQTPPDPAFVAVPPEELGVLFRGSPLVQIGSHGWSHRNLVALDSDDRAAELGRPLPWLAGRELGAGCGISYAYGLSNPEVEASAREAGYPWGLRVSGGFLDARESLPQGASAEGRAPNPWALPRLNVPAGLSRRGLALRLAGIGVS